jgi:DNA polymerase III subunit delta
MTYDQILNDLKNKIYRPVYFLMGEEPYFIDIISDYILENVLTEDEKEFNQAVLYGKDVDAGTIVDYAKRFPMMSNYQVVVVKEAQEIRNLVPGSSDKDDDEDTPATKNTDVKKSSLELYIEKPVPTTILVICYKYKKLDKRRAIYKLLDKNGAIFESVKLYDNQVSAWITGYLKRQGYTLTPIAAQLLNDYLGADLSRIVNELGKLIINIPAGTQITEVHIEQNIGISKDYNTFELQKALGKRDILKANRIAIHFGLNPKENPILKTIPILFMYFSRIINFHYLKDKSRDSVIRSLGISPSFVGEYMDAANNYPPSKLRKIVSLLREYDGKSKGIDNDSTSQGELLRELIFKILH